MSTSVLDEILGVRSMLANPLSQAPSFEDILDEMEAEYQNVTGQTNNTANAWQVDTYTLTTMPGVYDYEIQPCKGDFYKALSVTTVPPNVDTDPQFVLEFTELEYLPKEWAWLGQNKGQYMSSSHDSQICAFYRKITNYGEEIRVQLRPTPVQAQDYKILYQVTDWWPRVSLDQDSLADGFRLPHSSQRFYIRAIVAQNLLLMGKVQWGFDDAINFAKGQIVSRGLDMRIARYKAVYDEYIDSLDQPDVTLTAAWADDNVFQLG